MSISSKARALDDAGLQRRCVVRNATLCAERKSKLLVLLLATTALILPLSIASTARADDESICQHMGNNCIVSYRGDDGQDQKDPSKNKPGRDGTGGSPGGSIDLTYDSPERLLSNGPFSPLNLVSIGGRGGSGSNANSEDYPFAVHSGGNGHDGSAGGNIALATGPGVSGHAGRYGDDPVPAIKMFSFGGAGGQGGVASQAAGEARNGRSGTGGAGGNLSGAIDGEWYGTHDNGITALSAGGTGGHGGNSEGSKNTVKFGGQGGVGGRGGRVDITLLGSLNSDSYGAFVVSAGGDGGQGGKGNDTGGGQGGTGGAGGNAGAATFTLGATATASAVAGDSAVGSAAVYVGSLGGRGGAGGGGNRGGLGGNGGDAFGAGATINGTVTTSGADDVYGVLVQSAGGVGGNGGQSGAWFNPVGGDGRTGGKAGKATITGTGAVITTGSKTGIGQNAAGLMVQSIGGGGGTGGSVKDAWFEIGGSGGDGSSGNEAYVQMTDTTVTTWGEGAAGVIAQSIGGSGGKGGDATKSSGAIVNLTIGGTGGLGGHASDATADMRGRRSEVTTHGRHAAGMLIQSIGGGGGSGGAGYGITVSLFAGGSASVGGSGGAGGNGGTVNQGWENTNQGSILTFGDESFGIIGQSIGGGGGTAGASTAKSITFSPPNMPGQSLALSTGGTGGDGGSGSSVKLQNSGYIGTGGHGATALVAQSLGGGGGTAGDASAMATALGGGYGLSGTITHGGDGGAGGDGGEAWAINKGLIMTRGGAASGMLVQSVGGGGGNGGIGDGTAKANQDKALSVALNIGGRSGGGGHGRKISAENDGSILTMGDGAHGLMAQTIGGGGGNGGGGAASSSGTISLTANIGGQGGNGGDTSTYGSGSSALNTGSILTYGADTHAIIAQSIGGGGGAGGRAATTLRNKKSNGDGSSGDKEGGASRLIQAVSDITEKGMEDYDNLEKLIKQANGFLGNQTSDVGEGGTGEEMAKVAESGGETEDDNESSNVSLTVMVGGTGGIGGSAGTMTVTNTGDLGTIGAQSDAILVQSIGGGGGKGGAASPTASETYSGTVGVGGNGGGGKGDGGMAVVNNAGRIYTVGVLSSGIVAQSIGGGGGMGGSSIVTSEGEDGKKSYALNLSLGGASGSNSSSKAAVVTNTGAIETRAHNSHGIIAQSIAGGGGIIKSLAVDLDKGGSASAASQKDFAINLKFGGYKNEANHAALSGAAIVKTDAGGTITTTGDSSVGIIAQSVSGGGGLAKGGNPVGSTASEFLGGGLRTGSVNAGLSTDPNDNKGVSVTVGADITTSGWGSHGVFAQSVGGGGGIAGGLSQMWKTKMGRISGMTGDGGDIQVDLEPGVWIRTDGNSAAGVIAQSVGGGGGWFANEDRAYIGSAGGAGKSGTIAVNIYGGIDARGTASAGILAQSAGGASNGGTGESGNVVVTVGRASDPCTPAVPASCAQVYGGNAGEAFEDDAAAIHIVGGSDQGTIPDRVINHGYISTNHVNGTAIYSGGEYFAGENFGTIIGNIHGKGSFANNWPGRMVPYQSIKLGGGTLTNDGTLDLTQAGDVTTLHGHYDGRAGSRIVVGANFADGTGDLLDISGDAHFAGNVEVRPTALRKGRLDILRAGGDLTLGEKVGSVGGTFFTYDLTARNGSLSVSPQAHFETVAVAMGNNRSAVAGHLQDIWDADIHMDSGFAALSAVDSTDAAATLDMLSGQALGLIGATRYQSSREFVDSIWTGCEVAENGRCVWGKWTVSRASMGSSDDASGYDTQSSGFHFGGTRAVGENLTLGGAIGYERMSASDHDNFGKIEGDNIQLGSVLTWTQGDWRFSGAAELGYGWFDTLRHAVLGGIGGQALGSTNTMQAGLHGRAEWHRKTSWGFVEPRFDLSVLYVKTDGFIETGAGPFNLAVADASDTLVIATPAIATGRDVTLADGSTLKLSGSLGFALMSYDEWAPSARLESGLEGFEASSVLPGQLLKMRLHAELVTKGQTSLSAIYRGDFGDRYDNHAAELRLDYRF